MVLHHLYLSPRMDVNAYALLGKVLKQQYFGFVVFVFVTGIFIIIQITVIS